MAKVSFEMSYGMFEHDQLVGFIIHAVDERSGELTAYNTGTGVLPEYRGRRIVKSIYESALPDLRSNDITRCILEVITDNTVALQAYRSVGFNVCKEYCCFGGEIEVQSINSVVLTETTHHEIEWSSLPNQESYSWDNHERVIREGNYKCYLILSDGIPESYFVINPDDGNIAQFDLLEQKEDGWNRLFSGISQISSNVKLNNVDRRQKEKIDFLNSINLDNTIDQYEMELEL